MLRKSISGDSHTDAGSIEQVENGPSPVEAEHKKGKTYRSGESAVTVESATKWKSKKKKLSHSPNVTEVTDDSDTETSISGEGNQTKAYQMEQSLPSGTPEWGIRLLEIMQHEIRSVNTTIGAVKSSNKVSSKTLKIMEKHLATIEDKNRCLEKRMCS